MTGQIGDSYRIQDDAYTIVAMSEKMNFSPEIYGLVPLAVCTACWAGYWCDYVIEDTKIILKNLYINCKDEQYPPFNGVAVTKEKEEFEYLGHHMYQNVNLVMEYTGRIVIGKDFIQKYYIHK